MNNRFQLETKKKKEDVYCLLTLLFQYSRIAPVTVDANAVAGALISSGIGKEATNVVAAPATVPAKTIRASLFSDTSTSSTKQITSKKH
jgi:hypothetical protein